MFLLITGLQLAKTLFLTEKLSWEEFFFVSVCIYTDCWVLKSVAGQNWTRFYCKTFTKPFTYDYVHWVCLYLNQPVHLTDPCFHWGICPDLLKAEKKKARRPALLLLVYCQILLSLSKMVNVYLLKTLYWKHYLYMFYFLFSRHNFLRCVLHGHHWISWSHSVVFFMLCKRQTNIRLSSLFTPSSGSIQSRAVGVSESTHSRMSCWWAAGESQPSDYRQQDSDDARQSWTSMNGLQMPFVKRHLSLETTFNGKVNFLP